MLALIIAGEIVFGLPFHTARFFRPTLLEVFGFTNTQLGDLFALYGITAMISYFPGGALADRFPARSLLTASLFATGVGGLFMATIPAALPMGLLYAFWGVTTIFLFWGALIRATREWGGVSRQGLAFGVLEGGRGLVAALVATLALAIFAAIMPDNVALASDEDRRTGMQSIILVYTAAAFIAGVLTWFTVPVYGPLASATGGRLPAGTGSTSPASAYVSVPAGAQPLRVQTCIAPVVQPGWVSALVSSRLLKPPASLSEFAPSIAWMRWVMVPVAPLHWAIAKPYGLMFWVLLPWHS